MISMVDKNSYYNLEPLKNTIQDDSDFLISMLEIFIETNTISLSNLTMAIREKNWKNVGEIAHKMLSSFKHLEIDSAIPNLIWLEKLIWHVQPASEIYGKFEHLRDFSEKIFLMLKNDIKLLKNE